MIEKFLKAKHWHLFLLTFGIPLIVQFILMASMFANASNGSNSDSSFMVYYAQLFSIMMILFVGVFFGWFWSVAIGLQSKIPAGVKMKVKKFKIFFFTPLVYILFSLVFLTIPIAGEGPRPVIFAVAVPLHLFSMFCMFYILYFVAKTFKTAELQREVSFSDFAGEFFMIWFYPVGIWIIQPKINKIVKD